MIQILILGGNHLESWKFKTTNNYFEYLDFHDCVVEEIRLEKQFIIIYFEFCEYIRGTST
jgi:hypothetical protein